MRNTLVGPNGHNLLLSLMISRAGRLRTSLTLAARNGGSVSPSRQREQTECRQPSSSSEAGWLLNEISSPYGLCLDCFSLRMGINQVAHGPIEPL